MTGILTLFIVLIISLLIARIATVALTLTGLSRESARFQARSALTGVGFTTSEAESVVNHPVRRRIVMALMLVGGAGTVSVLASLILSFGDVDNPAVGFRRLGVVLGGLLVLFLVVRSRWADRWLSPVIERLLCRYTDLQARDYAGLLHLRENWMVAEKSVREDDWVAGHSLGELDLPREGVLVLGIQRRNGRWAGAPRSSTRPEPGDVLVLYGPSDVLRDIDKRRGGDAQARRAESQERFALRLAEQDREEAENESPGPPPA